MFSVLALTLNSHIKKDSQKYDDLITIESLRDYIIGATAKQPPMICDIINHKTRTMPRVIYSRPHRNMVRIFGIGEAGVLALNAIMVTLYSENRLRVKNVDYTIKNMQIKHDLPLLPFKDGAIHEYTTLTPISVFNDDNYRMFHHYEALHCGGKMRDASKEQKDAFVKAVRNFVNEQIRDFIKYLLSQIMPNKNKSDFLFVDDIMIEWVDFNILPRARYHTEERGMPMITGRFRSNFQLPKFIGLRIGKGFGELSLKSSTMESVA